MDTGADDTALHPADWMLIIPSNRWGSFTASKTKGGIGGSRAYADELALLSVVCNDGQVHILDKTRLDVGILTPQDIFGTPIPSIMGRDLLGRGTLQVNPQANLQVILDLPVLA